MPPHDNRLCDERHESCYKRMDSQAEDIKTLYATKASKSILFWTLGILFTLVAGSYAYTKTVADDANQAITKGDLQKYQDEIVREIRELRK